MPVRLPGWSKYRAKRTTVGGKTFQSAREAKRYSELLLMQKAGQIRQLQTQVPFDLIVRGVKVCRYVADFTYLELLERRESPGKINEVVTPIVEDCKGFRTDTYRLKAKLMKACLGIEIRET